MSDFVSKWLGAVSLAASMSVIWSVFIPYGFPWPGLAWIGLVFSAALWLRMRAPRSIAQVIAEIEAEPVRVVAPVRVVLPLRKAVL